jgi:CheY-like chemotaxis protein/tRNA A-37 threonylcarbamoyl transferase component Bud32
MKTNPMPSQDELFRNLTDSGLLSEEDLHAALDRFAAGQGGPPDGETLLAGLTSSGTLTDYQARAIRDRNFRELIVGNYAVLDRLGAGGMGTVYKARHRRMKRLVALKVLSQSAGKSEMFVRRFQREVETIAELTHPNIVMAYDADEAEVGHFLVMEFVDGRDLAGQVEESGPLSVAEAVDCVRQTALALEYAHSRGIIHRDIKPHNLLRTQAGEVKVTDLGLARFSEALTHEARDKTSITQAGNIVGTVDYMPPEQALGSTTIDHRADIYSLGCTLHFLLTGRPPYRGESLTAVLLLHQNAPLPSLRDARPDVPAALDQVFRRMIAKKPEDRFQSMTEVLQALEAVGPLPTGPSPSTAEAAAVNAPTLEAPASGPREGATVDLPAGQRTVAAPAAQESGPSAAILLAEPSRTQARIIGGYLQQLGHANVRTCASGEEALEQMCRSCPETVISAMYLPDMSGLALAGRMRAEEALRAVPFLLISSQTEADGLSAEELHGVTLLRKPFDASALGTALAGAKPAPRANPEDLAVLLVDDSLAARGRIRRALAELGVADVVEAADGAEAVGLLESRAFDLVVTDYNMPNLDGRGLVEYIRKRSRAPEVPVWMVTTEADPAKLDEVRRLGVTALFGKDFPPEQVRAALEDLFG